MDEGVFKHFDSLEIISLEMKREQPILIEKGSLGFDCGNINGR
jgi:hypothetical protein